MPPRIIILGLALCLVAGPSHAQAIDVGDHALALQREHTLRHRVNHVRKVRKKAPVAAKVPAVAAWNRTIEVLPQKPGCLAVPLVAQGLPAVTENRAKERARDAWAAEVASRFATRYMDLRFAADHKERCWRASVADNLMKSIRERAKEGLGMIDDQFEADKALSYQCELIATPCVPEWGDGGKP